MYSYSHVHPYYGPPGTVPNPYTYPGPLSTTNQPAMQDPSAESNGTTVTSGDPTLTPQPIHCELPITFLCKHVNVDVAFFFPTQLGEQ